MVIFSAILFDLVDRSSFDFLSLQPCFRLSRATSASTGHNIPSGQNFSSPPTSFTRFSHVIFIIPYLKYFYFIASLQFFPLTLRVCQAGLLTRPHSIDELLIIRMSMTCQFRTFEISIFEHFIPFRWSDTFSYVRNNNLCTFFHTRIISSLKSHF